MHEYRFFERALHLCSVEFCEITHLYFVYFLVSSSQICFLTFLQYNYFNIKKKLTSCIFSVHSTENRY